MHTTFGWATGVLIIYNKSYIGKSWYIVPRLEENTSAGSNPADLLKVVSDGPISIRKLFVNFHVI